MQYKKKINAAVLKQNCGPEAIVRIIKSLGLPVGTDKGEILYSNRGAYIPCLNVWRNDRSIGSARFEQGTDKYGDVKDYFTFMDWASDEGRGSDIIEYVRQVTGMSFVDCCDFVAAKVGMTLDDLEEEVDGQAEAKEQILKAQKQHVEKVARLLGLDGRQPKKWEFADMADPYAVAAMSAPVIFPTDTPDVKRKKERQYDKMVLDAKAACQMWMDKDIIKILPACDWEQANALAKENGGKITPILSFDLERRRIDYRNPKFQDNYKHILDYKWTGTKEEEEYLQEYLVVYKEFPKLSLFSLFLQDEDTYKDLIAAKKQERLDDIRAERRYIEDTVFNEEQYEMMMDALDRYKEEVENIDVT